MPSWSLGSTHARTTLGVSCQHRTWTTNRERRRRAWHVINSLGQHARLDDVGRGMIAWSLKNKYGQHTQSGDIDRCMPSSPLGSTHNRMTLGVAFHHRPWEAHRSDLGKRTRLDDVGRGMLSSPMIKHTIE
ncbi:hypothetical protein EJD97_024077 [Solanum chilense]|uniref:Uncharacterized protein n=1 Tax=Solanum chilense TaxID=4083 RepID=A0A6N2AR63_SOLCI|nr:hypothetical protein EJD97_024077 [Solanum chilense]